MTVDHADGRPRIYITSARDRQAALWSRHPAARPEFAASPGAALEAALASLNGQPAVIIWSGHAPPDP